MVFSTQKRQTVLSLLATEHNETKALKDKILVKRPYLVDSSVF